MGKLQTAFATHFDVQVRHVRSMKPPQGGIAPWKLTMAKSRALVSLVLFGTKLFDNYMLPNYHGPGTKF